MLAGYLPGSKNSIAASALCSLICKRDVGWRALKDISSGVFDWILKQQQLYTYNISQVIIYEMIMLRRLA
jgi:hypothetical protein